MKELIYVFAGGGAGSTLRFLVSLLWRHLSLHPRYADVVFPWPTFCVNIIGCFLIGLFYEYSLSWELSPEARLLLTTGLCGGFTTFSTFSYEGMGLLQSGHYGIYAIYLAASIGLGLLAASLPYIYNNII